MNQYIKSQIRTYCEMIKTGKPSALIPIQERYLDKAKKLVESENLKAYIENLSEGWKALWIYRDDYLIEVIKKMPEKPKTIYDYWVLGKIFGYSDEAIKNFIEKN